MSCAAALKRMPRQVKAIAGADGYLFYQNSLKYVREAVDNPSHTLVARR
jgi:hypothetical protein